MHPAVGLHIGMTLYAAIYILRPEQDGQHFAEEIFKSVSLNENFAYIHSMFVSDGLNGNNSALSEVMVSRQTGNKTLLEPMARKFYVTMGY